MGEILKKLGTINYLNQIYDIELNNPVVKDGKPEVHVQNSKVRLAVPENEFIQMVACIRLAKRQLDMLKSRETNDN